MFQSDVKPKQTNKQNQSQKSITDNSIVYNYIE